MIVTLQASRCIVRRQAGDPRFSGVRNAKGESRLLHHLKLALNAQGFDFVKIRMHKDGHLVADEQQYLRERKPVEADGIRRQLAIYNPSWAIAGADEAFRTLGQVSLTVVNLQDGA